MSHDCSHTIYYNWVRDSLMLHFLKVLSEDLNNLREVGGYIFKLSEIEGGLLRVVIANPGGNHTKP